MTVVLGASTVPWLTTVHPPCASRSADESSEAVFKEQLAHFKNEITKKDEAIAVLTDALRATTEKLQVRVADGGTVTQLVSEAEGAATSLAMSAAVVSPAASVGDGDGGEGEGALPSLPSASSPTPPTPPSPPTSSCRLQLACLYVA